MDQRTTRVVAEDLGIRARLEDHAIEGSLGDVGWEIPTLWSMRSARMAPIMQLGIPAIRRGAGESRART